MPEFLSIQNFKFGLDARRSDITSQPGVLSTCQNAHINAGAEIEKRKAFIRSAVAANTSLVFGMEATSTGLVMFGSTATPGALPAGVTYRRCVHPTTFKASGATASMTAAVSCPYQGKAFVLATFDDGNIFAYFGDVTPMPLVGQVDRNGNVLYLAGGAEGVTDLSTDLAALINALSNYVGLANQDNNGGGFNGKTVIRTPPKVYITPVTTKVSASGTLTALEVVQNVNGATTLAASCAFTLTGAAGTLQLQAPGTSAGPPSDTSANLTNGFVTYAGSLPAMATAIAAAVNAQTSVTGYSASASGATVTVYAPTAWGAAANTFVLTISVTGALVASTGTVIPVLTGTISIAYAPDTTGYITNSRPAVVTVTISGQSGPLSFNWSVTFPGVPYATINPSGVSNPPSPTATVAGVLGGGKYFHTATVSVIVSDGGFALPITLSVPVTISNTSNVF